MCSQHVPQGTYTSNVLICSALFVFALVPERDKLRVKKREQQEQILVGSTFALLCALLNTF